MLLFARVPLYFAENLPINRPFTRLEAAFQYDMDRLLSKDRSKLEYSKMWVWDRGKVDRFIKEINSKSDENVQSFSIKKPPQKRHKIQAVCTHVKQPENSMLQEQNRNYTAISAESTNSLFIEEKEREETFVQFWNLYPNKKNKAGAFKIWCSLNPSPETLSAIMTALDCQCQQPDWKKNGGQFIPHPSTWLNKRRWEDELSAQVLPAINANMQRSRREELRAQGLDV